MPRKDGTGPMGQGAMIGRGLGLCRGINAERCGLGRGYGLRRGFARGYGRVMCENIMLLIHNNNL